MVLFRGFFPVFSINHPDYVRHILTQAYPNYTKNTIDYRVIARTLGNGLVTNDGPDWTRPASLDATGVFQSHDQCVRYYD